MEIQPSVLFSLDQLVPKYWANDTFGLSKNLISFSYKSIIKASDLSKCYVTIQDVILPNGYESEYLRHVNESSFEITIGSALTPIDWYIEKFLQAMLVDEKSQCTIKTKSNKEIIFVIHLQRVEFGGYYHEKSLKEMVELSKNYKENGVKMFKKYPQLAHEYFSKAARCLQSYIPYNDIYERANNEGINADELLPMLENLLSNIAACLLKENRSAEVSDILSFTEQQDSPVEKVIFRKATAYLNTKEHEKALQIIEKKINYKENKDLLALHEKIHEDLKNEKSKYADMVKKMFN